MLDAVILIPSAVASIESRSQSSEDNILRDFVLLATVFAMHCLHIPLPRGLFVAAGFFVLLSEMINDLTYRLLPPSKKLKDTWLLLQSRQIKKDLIRYIELRNCGDYGSPCCPSASHIDANLLRINHMGTASNESSEQKVAAAKNDTSLRLSKKS